MVVLAQHFPFSSVLDDLCFGLVSSGPRTGQQVEWQLLVKLSRRLHVSITTIYVACSKRVEPCRGVARISEKGG